jgi:hypothetical protein
MQISSKKIQMVVVGKPVSFVCKNSILLTFHLIITTFVILFSGPFAIGSRCLLCGDKVSNLMYC